jgi:hypothetical protein
MIERTETVDDLHIDVATRERGTGYPLGVFRDWIGNLGV